MLATIQEDVVSTSFSVSQWVVSSSIPEVSREEDSFPSRSAFGNSSVSASDFALLFLHECVEVSFSVRQSTWITDLVFFSKLGMLVPLVDPVIPVRVESSARVPMFSGFHTECAAEHELYSVDYFLTSSHIVNSLSPYDPLGTVERQFSYSHSGNNNDASTPPVWGASSSMGGEQVLFRADSGDRGVAFLLSRFFYRLK